MGKRHLTINGYKKRLILFFKVAQEIDFPVPISITAPMKIWEVDEIGRNRMLVAAHRLFKRGILIRTRRGYYTYNPDYFEKLENKTT